MRRLAAIMLASWWAAVFLATERGPYALATRLRDRYPDTAMVMLTEVGARELVPGDNLAEATQIDLNGAGAELGRVLRCPYCSMVWIAAGLTWLDRPGRGRLLIDTLAAAGGARVLLDLMHLSYDARLHLLDGPIPGGLSREETN